MGVRIVDHTIDGGIPAPSVAEIRHRGQFSLDWRAGKPALVEVGNSLLSVLLIAETDVNVANEMLSKVVAHVELFNRPVLVPELNKHILVEFIVVLLQLTVGYGAPWKATSVRRRLLGLAT